MRTRVMSFLAGVVSTLAVLAVGAAVVGVRPDNIHAYRSPDGHLAAVYLIKAQDHESTKMAEMIVESALETTGSGLDTKDPFKRTVVLGLLLDGQTDALITTAGRLLGVSEGLQVDVGCGGLAPSYPTPPIRLKMPNGLTVNRWNKAEDHRDPNIF